tara:strand:+ start:2736 stop:3401 length:666 start_codon:yes stop_codon:yes gene_type:complete
MFTLNKDFSQAVRNAGIPQGRRTPEQNDNSPLRFDWSKGLDWAQTGLTAAGMIPGLGNIADAANVAISGGRAGYAKLTGDEEGAKGYLADMAINAAAMVPGAGLAVGGAKLASKAAKAGGVVKGAKTVAKGVKEGAKTAVKTSVKSATDVAKQGVKETAKKTVNEYVGKEGVKNVRKVAALEGSKSIVGDEAHKQIAANAEKKRQKNLAQKSGLSDREDIV